PAIDAGTPTGAPSFDQRGLPRPSGAGFDIGAFEVQAAPSTKPIFAVGSDAGAPQRVQIYDSQTGHLMCKFFAFDPNFTGGVLVRYVTVSSGPGGPTQVKVIDGTKFNQLQANGEIANSALLASFDAYDPTFTGGVNIAVGNINGDKNLDLITAAGAGGGPHV